MLRALEQDFQVYPPYWFYRAKAAQESDDNKEAHLSFEKFNKFWRPVLRQDPYMVEALKFRISELAKKGNLAEDEKHEALTLLEAMRTNTPRDDWSNNVFAGVAYFLLGKKDEGIDILETNVDFGYGVEISKPIVAQMKDGKLDLALIPDELKNLLSKQESEEKIISQKTEQRDLTFKEWKELVKITKKYGFSLHFDWDKENLIYGTRMG